MDAVTSPNDAMGDGILKPPGTSRRATARVLAAGVRSIRWRGRSQHPEGLLLRPPQRLRHAFDPKFGALRNTEFADDAYSELDRVIAGMNGG